MGEYLTHGPLAHCRRSIHFDEFVFKDAKHALSFYQGDVEGLKVCDDCVVALQNC